MKTLYIDIFFLVNFTVDIISLHFAAMLSKIKVSNRRLLVSAMIGAASACISVFVKMVILDVALLISTLALVSYICGKNAGRKGKLIFIISLIIFLSLVGSIVSITWSCLDDAFSDYLIENDTINRKMLFFALIALLSIGVFKMLIAVMNSGKIETTVDVEISFSGKTCFAGALIDTGNLAMDPLGMKPVLIIKKKLAEQLVSYGIINLSNMDDLDNNIKRRIRLVPLTKSGTTHIYTGFVPDDVKVLINGKKISVDVTVIIDKEGGDFGGYLALMPFSAISNVVN